MGFLFWFGLVVLLTGSTRTWLNVNTKMHPDHKTALLSVMFYLEVDWDTSPCCMLAHRNGSDGLGRAIGHNQGESSADGWMDGQNTDRRISQ